MSNLSTVNPQYNGPAIADPETGSVKSTDGAPKSTLRKKMMAVAASVGVACVVTGVAVASYSAGVSEGRTEMEQTATRNVEAAQGLVALECVGDCLAAPPADYLMPAVMKLKEEAFARYQKEDEEAGVTNQVFASSTGRVNCVNGFAGEFPCNNIDMLGFVSISDMGGSGSGNDIWGWTDPATGKEWAIMGVSSGTAFVDVSDPTDPKPRAFVRSTNNRSSQWRDVKTYANHAFIGSEASGHGMQVFDLTRLRSLTSLTTLSPDTTYSEIGQSHNIVINEESGFAYVVGARSSCSGGLHIVNIRTPKSPTFAGCFSADGYTHDAQCVIYRGPDSRYQGREVCFAYNEDTLTIVDVQDKSNTVQISRTRYAGSAYSHQGWLTEDQEFLLLDDELDEDRGNNDGFTQTYVWNVRDLRNPTKIYDYFSPVKSIDHNLYTKGGFAYQSNYGSGLRITDVSDIANSMSEVAFFDVYPSADRVEFRGTWSNYPYFASGNIIVSSIERGLFVLKANLAPAPPTPPTPAPTPFPTGPPTESNDCDCDGGSGTYESCVYYSALSDNVCLIKHTGGSSNPPPCAEPGSDYRYSNNFSRWYKVGCEIARAGEL